MTAEKLCVVKSNIQGAYATYAVQKFKFWGRLDFHCCYKTMHKNT